MAAPRAARLDGARALDNVEGDIMLVVVGNFAARREATFGVWEVPPQRITWQISDKVTREELGVQGIPR